MFQLILILQFLPRPKGTPSKGGKFFSEFKIILLLITSPNLLTSAFCQLSDFSLYLYLLLILPSPQSANLQFVICNPILTF
jgi:hypothetical protein